MASPSSLPSSLSLFPWNWFESEDIFNHLSYCLFEAKMFIFDQKTFVSSNNCFFSFKKCLKLSSLKTFSNIYCLFEAKKCFLLFKKRLFWPIIVSFCSKNAWNCLVWRHFVVYLLSCVFLRQIIVSFCSNETFEMSFQLSSHPINLEFKLVLSEKLNM